MSTKKPLFDLSNYKGRYYCMNCYTIEERNVFFEFLNSHKRKWCTGERYSSRGTEWYDKKEETCYAFNVGEYSRRAFYADNGYTVLNFEDFDWSEYGYTDNQYVNEIDESELSGFLEEFAVFT